MLSALKSLFSTDKKSKPETAKLDQDEKEQVNIAFAALLIEAAKADENYDDHERAIITGILRNQFELSESRAVELHTKAEAAQADAIDLHRFTREVKTLPEKERINFIEGLWRVVLSDGVRDPFEDALIRRISSLIHLTDRDSGEARKRVEAE